MGGGEGPPPQGPAAGRPDACLEEIGKRLARLRLRSVTVAARVSDETRGAGGGLVAAKRAAAIVVKAGVPADRVSVVAPRVEAAEPPSLQIAYLEAARGRPVARLRGASGPVNRQTPGGEPQPVSPGADLYLDDEVQTGDGVVADLALLDGSALRLMPGSRVRVIAADAAARGRKRVLLELLEGELINDVPSAPDRTFEIRSQTAIAGVRGTLFRSVAGPAGLRVETLGGAVNLASAGQGVDVAEGKGALAPPGAAPGRPVDLPPAPTAVRPLAGDAGLPVVLEWDGAPAVEHRVELARDPEFVLGYRQIRAQGARQPVADLAPGRWFWRVTAVSPDGFVGRPSKIYAFRIQGP